MCQDMLYFQIKIPDSCKIHLRSLATYCIACASVMLKMVVIVMAQCSGPSLITCFALLWRQESAELR